MSEERVRWTVRVALVAILVGVIALVVRRDPRAPVRSPQTATNRVSDSKFSQPAGSPTRSATAPIIDGAESSPGVARSPGSARHWCEESNTGELETIEFSILCEGLEHDRDALDKLRKLLREFRERFRAEFGDWKDLLPGFGCRHICAHVLPALDKLKHEFESEAMAVLNRDQLAKLRKVLARAFPFDQHFYSHVTNLASAPETGGHPANPCPLVQDYERRQALRVSKKP